MIRSTFAHVDLGALAANFRAIVSFLARVSEALPARRPPRVIAVVKANAYGHGAVPVGRALERAGATMLACADIEEAIVLREGGVTCDILVFGALSVSDLEGIFEYGLTPTISTPSAGRALQRAAATRGVRLHYHLKIDTGMNRLGFRHDNLRTTLPELLGAPDLALDAVYTHFATADDPEDELFASQHRRFDAAIGQLATLGVRPPALHAANSAATLRDPRVWFDYVRPGILLYGVSPSAGAKAPAYNPASKEPPGPSNDLVGRGFSPANDAPSKGPAGPSRELPGRTSDLFLRPVLTLRSRVVAVKGVRVGEPVGYGARFVAARPTDIATVPAGYADGLDLRLAGRGAVLIAGRRAPIVGAVSMDMMAVDVTGIPVEPGDPVTILGADGDDTITVEEMAAAIGTIPYEILCRVGTRIERVYNSG
ncbi:MAG: alanine racemase [Bacteroidales bacterium]